MTDLKTVDATGLPWRQGRSQPRNVYAQTGDDWKAHPLIGHMDTGELAEEAVNSHNTALAATRAAERAERAGVRLGGGMAGVQIGDNGNQVNYL